MTKRLSLIALLFISLFSACNDDPKPYQCTECTDAPEANASYDNTGQGIYKGVLIGSSGTVKFDIANNGTTISGEFVIDGTTVVLTGNGSYSPSTGFNGSFTGSLDGGTVIIPFTVTITGGATIGTPTIPGHPNVIFGIFKERSNQLVQAFEGTFSGDHVGTFNLVVRRGENGAGVWYAISRRTLDSSNAYFEGQISATGELTNGGDTVITGSLKGDNVKGTYSNTSISGAWTGKRTL